MQPGHFWCGISARSITRETLARKPVMVIPATPGHPSPGLSAKTPDRQMTRMTASVLRDPGIPAAVQYAARAIGQPALIFQARTRDPGRSY